MNVIKNEKGTFVELPRESITFCGNTEEEKKANELIFDLSLENDGLQQELERYKNIIYDLEKWLYTNLPIREQQDLQIVIDKLKELKGE